MVLDFASSAPVQDQDDPSIQPQRLLEFPWIVNQEGSYLDYRCWIEVELDAGMVLHKALPQSFPTVDTLASVYITDPNFATPSMAFGGVNLQSNSQAVDVIQRMATSTYRFRLRGWGVRAAYQVPIPGIIKINGIVPVPEGKQRAFNVIVGNGIGGIPIWYGVWDIPYVLPSCPQRGATAPIAPNPALHVGPQTPLPAAAGIDLPETPTDQRATQAPQQPQSRDRIIDTRAFDIIGGPGSVPPQQ